MRIILAGIIGAIILFVWGSVSWMLLPYHTQTISHLTNEDAVLVGAGTIRADNPPLTVRDREMRAYRRSLGKPEILPAIEIGWRLGQAYWGKGLATEAARTVMEFGFVEVGLDEIVSIHQDLQRQEIPVGGHLVQRDRIQDRRGTRGHLRPEGRSDPDEQIDRIRERPDVARRFRPLLRQWLREHPLKRRAAAEIDDELEQTLRALGYL